MNFLLDNPLVNLYGPYFLILYLMLIIFALIFLSVVKYYIDTTDKLPTPPIPSAIDPFEIAYLRGGYNELVRSLIFSLYQKEFIDLSYYGSTAKIEAVSNPPSRSNLTEIESVAFEYLRTKNDVSRIFKDYGLVDRLHGFGNNYQTRLERAQLLTTAHAQSRFFQWKGFVLLSMLALAVYKIIAALSHGRMNVFFTIAVCATGLFLTYFFSNFPRITKLGKTYLDRLQLTFNDLRHQKTPLKNKSDKSPIVPQTAFGGIDPMLLSVGIFGAGVVAGTAFDSFSQVFHRSQRDQALWSNSSCSSGCGSSCSIASSCSSGSSCGGGSSCSSGCGGGCGGCGS